MKKGKKWARTAIVLFAIGILLAFAGLACAGFSLENLNARKIVETVLEPEGEFENISLVTLTSDVNFRLSADGKTKIVCREMEKIRHYAEVSENTLRIDSVDTREWFDKIGINFGDVSITVYLPESAYQSLFAHVTTGDIRIPADFSFENVRIEGTTTDIFMYADVHETLKLKTTTGDIDVRGINAKEISVRLTTGDAQLTNVTAADIYVKTTTGKIRLTNAISQGKLVCECTTGGIRFDACDAGEIIMSATTGDILGTFLTEKTVRATATTGAVRVPTSLAGGMCQVTTTTGDIEIRIEG